MKREDAYVWTLVDAIQNTGRNRRLLRSFLRDLLTPQELADVATRWQIVKQLSWGIPQRTIAKNLKVGIATVTRGSRELQDTSGGFYQVLHK